MKHLLTGLIKSSIAIVFIASLNYSCKKAIRSEEDKPSQLSVVEAKSFFENVIRKSNKKEKFTVSSDDIDVSKFANWSGAYIKRISLGDAIIVPLTYGDANPYLFIDRENKAGIPLDKLSYLMIYKNQKREIAAEWVVYKPDSAWVAGDRSVFRGEIHIKDWYGKLLRAFKYQDNGIATSLSVSSKIPTVKYVGCFSFSVGYCANLTLGSAEIAKTSIVTRRGGWGCAYRIKNVTECFGSESYADDIFESGGGAGSSDYPPDCDPNATTTSGIKGSAKVSGLIPCGGTYAPIDPVAEEARCQEIFDAIDEEPFLIIGCDKIASFVALHNMKPSSAILQRLETLKQTINKSSFHIQQIQDASGSVINCDYFPVTIEQFPTINGQQVGASGLLEYFRLNINSFLNDSEVFTPYNQTGLNDTQLWNSSDPLGAILHLDLIDDGSVVVID